MSKTAQRAVATTRSGSLSGWLLTHTTFAAPVFVADEETYLEGGAVPVIADGAERGVLANCIGREDAKALLRAITAALNQ